MRELGCKLLSLLVIGMTTFVTTLPRASMKRFSSRARCVRRFVDKCCLSGMGLQWMRSLITVIVAPYRRPLRCGGLVIWTGRLPLAIVRQTGF